MATTYTAPTPFAAWLKGELDTRGWGVRTLAKRMAPENVEVARRAVNRVIHEGSQPSAQTRAAIARGLGIAEADLPAAEKSSSSEDDEEADPVALLFNRAVEAALTRLQKKQSPPRDLPVVTGTGSNQQGA